ncbi:FxDxF family PEP-CTERM protein [Methylophilus sp. Leaf408]|uniref:FxDxF family PEP-CTERM protein n=1 Tax=Methylophilus sp. Leaf408 TaxID=2876561 RepID=UPI001E62AC8A|nr:FxDxF family PEP-CTERM protein [Methylophilus sp. Leaf408]
MLGKAFLLAGLLVSTGANATTPLNQTGTDPSGTAIDKTTIIDLPTQSTAFNFIGSLDAVGSLITNQSPGTTFGLYLDDVLLKDISSFQALAGNVYQFEFLNLAAGDYSFRFNINGNEANRAYTFTSTITAITPVPEPESISLMMFGIGIAGFMARRRKTA